MEQANVNVNFGSSQNVTANTTSSIRQSGTFSELYNDVSIEDNKLTLGDLCKEMKNDLEIEIFIQTQY